MNHTRESAETIALQALGWLVGDEELLPIFQGATGISEGDLRAAAADPVLLGSVLDFILMDDAWIIACCDAQKIPYERLMEVRQNLPGGESVHWT